MNKKSRARETEHALAYLGEGWSVGPCHGGALIGHLSPSTYPQLSEAHAFVFFEVVATRQNYRARACAHRTCARVLAHACKRACRQSLDFVITWCAHFHEIASQGKTGFSEERFRSVDLWVMGPARSPCATSLLLTELERFQATCHYIRNRNIRCGPCGTRLIDIARQ